MTLSTQTIRQQYPLVGYSRLTLQEDGLHVEEKRFFSLTELVLPYEEIMPIGVARQHNFPFRLSLVALFLCFGCGKACYTILTQPEQRESNLLLLLILAGLLAGVAAQCFRTWRHDFILTTGRGNILLFDSRQNRQALYEFVNTVRDHAIRYLRSRYAIVDPLRPAGPQLEQLEELRNMGVLTDSQLQELKTRLVGLMNDRSILGDESVFRPSMN